MLRSTLVRRLRVSQRQASWPRAACFSSNSGGGGGGSGTAGGGSGGFKDDNVSIENNRNLRGSNKPNFEKNFLQPAARGELRSSYKSGIPRLAARKHKAHLEHPKKAERLSPVTAGHLLDEEWDEEAAATTTTGEAGGHVSSLFAALQRDHERDRQQQQQQQASQPGMGVAGMKAPDDDDMEQDDFYAPEFYVNNDDKYYWMEEDYDPFFADDDEDLLGDDYDDFTVYYDKKRLNARLPAAGGKDDQDLPRDRKARALDDVEEPNDEDDRDELAAAGEKDEGDADEDEDDDKGPEDDDDQAGKDEVLDEEELRTKKQRDAQLSSDPDQYFFYDQNDILEIASGDDKDKRGKKRDMKKVDDYVYDPLPETVLPLKSHGPGLDDFLQAIMEHPSAYARVDYINLHPHSKREPKPFFPRNRAQPPKEFVGSFYRFLFVTGLPALELDGEVGDLENPIHRTILQQTIARIVGVDSTRVFPVNTTSGFVGFDSPKELAEALSKGPADKFISSVPDISVPMGDDASHEFVKTDPDRVLLLSNMPPGNTATSLLRDLFPADTEVGAVYDGMTTDDFHFLSATSVLVRFASQEHAQSALDSHLVRDQLNAIGQYTVRYFRARRELLHAGFNRPFKSNEIRKPGPRLIVDGDMPSRKFFLSHAGVVHLRNVDPMLTKEEISRISQPVCAQVRDIQGSIEFVTCHAGLRTGEAYIGFDIPGEAEAFMQASKGGRVVMGDRPAILRKVHDRQVPGQPPIRVEKRLERTEKELLDDLNNWEKYVDPADLEQLQKAGISKAALDEAMRSIRFDNATFGPLDSALRSEALEPEKGAGELYKEMVQLYIETLKDCLPSKEDVGPMYELLHFPDEPIDLSIFDREMERQKQLQERRENA